MFLRRHYKSMLLTLAIIALLFLIRDFSTTRSFFTSRQSIKECDFTVNLEAGNQGKNAEAKGAALESIGRNSEADGGEEAGNEITPVTSIVVMGAGGLHVIDSPGGVLQMSALVEPDEATDKSVTWSVLTPGDDARETEVAAINDTGLLTALSDGEVVVVATANDGSGQSGELLVTVFNQNGYEFGD